MYLGDLTQRLPSLMHSVFTRLNIPFMLSAIQPDSTMLTESRIISSKRNNNCAKLANTDLVLQTHAAADNDPSDPTKDQNNTTVTMGPEKDSPFTQQSDASCLSDIRESYEAQGISTSATNIIVSSGRSSSGKLYQSYISRWKTCGKRKIHFIRPPVGVTLDFLVQLYENGASIVH